MYEAKYRKYITYNKARFAEPDEIRQETAPSYNGVAGVPIYAEGDTVYVDSSDNHSIVIGPTGCKKSRTVARTTISSILEAGESALITDPKGELYRSTRERATALGYRKVFLLNLRSPGTSDGWNPLRRIYDLYAAGEFDKAQRGCIDLAASLAAQVYNADDRYWENISQRFLASILMLYLTTVPSKEYYTLQNILPLCYREAAPYLKTALRNLDPNSSIAGGLHGVLDLDSEKTICCVYSVLLTSLSCLTESRDLLNMLSDGNVNFVDMATQKTLIFVMYPDEKKSIEFMVNHILTSAYEELVDYASSLNEDRCPIRINMVIDEFSNLPGIQNFSNRISEARSKNIRYILFIQSYHQLQEKYKASAETILSNCANWIVFSTKEIPLLNKVSEISGTVEYNGYQYPLLSTEDMQYLRKEENYAEAVVLHQGLHPYVAQLPDFYYLPIASKYPEAVIPKISRPLPSSEYTLSPMQWIEHIKNGVFKFPLFKQVTPE